MTRATLQHQAEAVARLRARSRAGDLEAELVIRFVDGILLDLHDLRLAHDRQGRELADTIHDCEEWVAIVDDAKAHADRLDLRAADAYLAADPAHETLAALAVELRNVLT